MNFKGKVYEEVASNYLLNKGYKIVDRNFAVKGIGEIDIITIHNNWIVFIEVRARKRTYYNPYETINKTKMSKIIKTSLVYLKKNPQIKYKGIRYDVISIEDDGFNNLKIDHIEEAFSSHNKYYF
ncbi:MAG: YraN family protein [Elusimicrobiales bacterium]|nr:YraN family protein [Elusimicrobiales bacterium]